MKFDKDKLEEQVIEKLKTIQDLELPISIYDLGLVYKIEVIDNNDTVSVDIDVTVINSRCSSTKSFTDIIKNKVISIDDVDECNVKFVFSPKWDVSMISANGLQQLRESVQV